MYKAPKEGSNKALFKCPNERTNERRGAQVEMHGLSRKQ